MQRHHPARSDAGGVLLAQGVLARNRVVLAEPSQTSGSRTAPSASASSMRTQVTA
jgi:hypothetical protein